MPDRMAALRPSAAATAIPVTLTDAVAGNASPTRSDMDASLLARPVGKVMLSPRGGHRPQQPR
jgi:hypothetical protein